MTNPTPYPEGYSAIEMAQPKRTALDHIRVTSHAHGLAYAEFAKKLGEVNEIKLGEDYEPGDSLALRQVPSGNPGNAVMYGLIVGNPRDEIQPVLTAVVYKGTGAVRQRNWYTYTPEPGPVYSDSVAVWRAKRRGGYTLQDSVAVSEHASSLRRVKMLSDMLERILNS